ncbi:hypothetical protein F5Y11DRAFT_367042 [Daldinia sp. FL1419]|nr:hypothetical protein F5Y11DRAFT_367042 [Daldinia sp. FL1419]
MPVYIKEPKDILHPTHISLDWSDRRAAFASHLPHCQIKLDERQLRLNPDEYVSFVDPLHDIALLDTLPVHVSVIQIYVQPGHYTRTERLYTDLERAFAVLGSWKPYYHCEVYWYDGQLLDTALWDPIISIPNPGARLRRHVQFVLKPKKELLALVNSKMTQWRQMMRSCHGIPASLRGVEYNI